MPTRRPTRRRRCTQRRRQRCVHDGADDASNNGADDASSEGADERDGALLVNLQTNSHTDRCAKGQPDGHPYGRTDELIVGSPFGRTDEQGNADPTGALTATVEALTMAAAWALSMAAARA